MFSKHLGKSALTESDRPGAIGDAKISFPKQMHSLINDFRAPDPRTKAAGQEYVHSRELVGGNWEVTQPVCKGRVRANVLETDGALKEQVGSFMKQPGKASGFNYDSEQLFHIFCSDDLVSCSSANDDGLGKTLGCLSIFSAVGEVVTG